MPRQRVFVDVRTPQWRWCDLRDPKDPKYKIAERCRFCQEIKERGKGTRYFCLLHNVELALKGDAVEKTLLCVTNSARNQILDLTEEPISEAPTDHPVDGMKNAVRSAIDNYNRLASEFIKAGVPADAAYKIAKDQVLKEWK